MRRVLAVLAATGLLVAFASSSLAAPTSSVNRFIGNFDMLDPDTGQVVAHVDASFTQPSSAKLVPGTLDITWAPDVTDDMFPFMDLEWKPVRESHAQLIGGYFGIEAGYATIAGTGGYLCDYTVEYWGDCRPFSVHFDVVDEEGASNVVWWSVPEGASPEVMFTVGKGAFQIILGTPTEG